MQVRFWGTRGSLARPGPTTLRYGGNTSCVEVRTSDGGLIILDCGTGIYGLGQALMGGDKQPLRGSILITHTHWDHIQGFPFFAPLFVSGNEWDVYAPGGLGRRLEETLAGQMDYTYFPVTLEELGSTVRFHDLMEGDFRLGSVHVTAHYLNHPTPTLGYRLEEGGAVLVYSTDHEPYSPHVHADTRLPVHPEDVRHLEFLADADLVIHDSQYTAAEYPQKVGWGHTPIENAIDFSVAARAKRLALFHHDPLRDDNALDAVIADHREALRERGSNLELFGAAEGQVIELVEQRAATVDEAVPAEAAEVLSCRKATVLIADDSPIAMRMLSNALEPEGFRLLKATDGEAALLFARAERPDLVLIDWEMPGLTGVQVCQQLRNDPDPAWKTVPIVLITAHEEPAHLQEAFDAGATDYLTKPFVANTLRARVDAWLLRHSKATADQPQ